MTVHVNRLFWFNKRVSIQFSRKCPPSPRGVVYKDGSRSFSLLPIFHRKMRHYILICLVCSAIQFEVSVTAPLDTLASGLQALERVLVSRRIH